MPIAVDSDSQPTTVEYPETGYRVCLASIAVLLGDIVGRISRIATGQGLDLTLVQICVEVVGVRSPCDVHRQVLAWRNEDVVVIVRIPLVVLPSSAHAAGIVGIAVGVNLRAVVQPRVSTWVGVNIV